MGIISYEHITSFFGLLVLMGIAWAFSQHRKAINYRTIIWGVGLQLLLAISILRTGTASFCGLFVLCFLVVLYVFEEELGKRFGRVGAGVLGFFVSAAAVALFYFLAPMHVTLTLWVAAVLAVAVGIKIEKAHVARPALAAVLILGLAELWARGIDGQQVFKIASDGVAGFLGLSNKGAEFLFSNLARGEHFFPGPDAGWPGFGFQFAFTVLPTIIFFSAFMSVMYHLGVVQVVIGALARFMHWSMGTSGSETMSCSGNVFVGQTEAPFLIKPFLEDMTISELHAVMVGGFATIAGGVLAGYIQMGVNPGHLIAASVMSAPAALVIAKLLYPETEESKTSGEVEIPKMKTAGNVVEAAANGTFDGLQLALNVGAMLIAFIALIAVLDKVLGAGDFLIDGKLLGGVLVKETGEFAGFFPGSMKTLFGTVLRPLAWIMGVPWADTVAVGNLLGIKLTVNEFVSYGVLSEYIKGGEISERSAIISTYALCGFANFSSIGIQIGGIGSLAPSRRAELAQIGVRAMFGGALASWMTATVAGMLL